jgi:zinc D-Ala-D-Ala carboxypeptidase
MCWQHHAALNGGVASRKPARTSIRRIRIRRRRAVALLIVAASAAALAHQLPVSSSSTDSLPSRAPSARTASSPAPAALPAQVPPGERPGPDPGSLGEVDGAIPDNTTVFDDEVPGVVKLNPALLAALRRAATDARGYGVEFFVDSGWRSRAYQEHLLQEAVAKYGSKQEAARWVATPNTSPHVAGDAADLGSDAARWLSEHGAAYGLCQIYGNEPWHYELRPEAIAHGCPPMYSDPTQDPRMQ